jgi:hypothetical protein
MSMTDNQVSGTGQSAGDGHPGRKIESISRNSTGQVVVRLMGSDESIVDARIARCFPWSVPDAYVSVRNKEGKEIVLLRTLEDLDEASRTILQQELHDKVFSPKILRIIEHNSEFGITSITAETDRGPVTFQIRTRDDVRILSDRRLLFRDADGNTYEVSDVTALDGPSRKFLQDYF